MNKSDQGSSSVVISTPPTNQIKPNQTRPLERKIKEITSNRIESSNKDYGEEEKQDINKDRAVALTSTPLQKVTFQNVLRSRNKYEIVSFAKEGSIAEKAASESIQVTKWLPLATTRGSKIRSFPNRHQPILREFYPALFTFRVV